MTHISAALCKDRTKIVMVADRMVSEADGSLHFEHEPKGQMVSYNARVLTTGTKYEPEIINLSMAEITGRMKIPNMVEILAKHYRDTRKKRIENEVLSKHGFSTFEEYHNKQKLLAESTVKYIERELQDEDNELGLTILFAGFDTSIGKGQIYVICDPGSPYCHSEVGFCCLGIGDRHADPVFAFYGYKPSMELLDTLYISYVAKRKAQMSGGVGKETDAWVIDEKGCNKVKQKTLDELEAIYDKANSSDLYIEAEIEYEDEPELPDEEG